MPKLTPPEKNKPLSEQEYYDLLTMLLRLRHACEVLPSATVPGFAQFHRVIELSLRLVKSHFSLEDLMAYEDKLDKVKHPDWDKFAPIGKNASSEKPEKIRNLRR